jgi:hypothetical protein
MTTTGTKITTAAEPILAVDLGKYKSVACLYRSAECQTSPPSQPAAKRSAA